MALTAADLKFFAATTLTDAADGGSRRSSTVVQNGLDNNLFPDVTASDRVAGQTRLRKVYPSLTNADTVPLLTGAVAMDSEPADANTRLLMFSTGDASTTRSAAVTALQGAFSDGGQVYLYTVGAGTGNALTPSATFTSGGTVVTLPSNDGDPGSPSTLYSFIADLVGSEVSLLVGGKYYLRRVVSQTFQTHSGGGVWAGSNTVTVDPVLPTFVAGASLQLRLPTSTPTVKCFGIATSADALASAATQVQLVSAFGRVSPAYGSSSLGVSVPAGPTGLWWEGKVPIIRNGDAITIWDEQALAPATATVSTVSTGRTDLDQLSVVGNNGVEIARFLKDGPTPVPTSGAMTANLTAGTVTFTSVTGFSQPVTVRHRIKHQAVITGASGALLTFSPALTRSFPSGCKISSHLPLGDVQARAYNVFAQQTWTRVFSDTLAGNSITLPYSGNPVVTNQGADTDRWAIVFTSGNTFDCYSEARGLIASGNTASTFSPINPATTTPFFTLASSGWASTLLVGSVLRFNTEAAAPPVWVLRCTVPGASSSQVTAALRLLGSV